jgi:hypothetical protein
VQHWWNHTGSGKQMYVLEKKTPGLVQLCQNKFRMDWPGSNQFPRGERPATFYANKDSELTLQNTYSVSIIKKTRLMLSRKIILEIIRNTHIYLILSTTFV